MCLPFTTRTRAFGAGMSEQRTHSVAARRAFGAAGSPQIKKSPSFDSTHKTTTITTMNVFKNCIFSLLLLGLFGGAVAAQTQNPDKQFAEEWAQRNPQVQWLSKQELEERSAAQQTQIRLGGQYLIYAEGYPQRAEIEAFEQARQQRASGQPNAEKEKWYAQKKAKFVVPPPPAPQFELTRAELSNLPESKRQHVLAHPETYKIKD